MFSHLKCTQRAKGGGEGGDGELEESYLYEVNHVCVYEESKDKCKNVFPRSAGGDRNRNGARFPPLKIKINK